jgi:hypothetical protein
MQSPLRMLVVAAVALCLIIGGAVATPVSTAVKKPQHAGIKKQSRSKKVRVRSARSRRRYVSRRGRRRGTRVRRRTVPNLAAVNPKTFSSGIPSERVVEIQNALIKLGYLEGPASAEYDETTISAMKQFQIDNHLSPTGLPSAHSLKKLGVSKTSKDGYSVPVKSVSEKDKYL